MTRTELEVLSDPWNVYRLRTFDIKMSEVLPGLFVGNQYDAEDVNALRLNKIDNVINVTGAVNPQLTYGIDYCWFGLNQPFGDTLKLAKMAVAKLADLRLYDKRCLAHCFEGIDRSPTIVYKYLVDHLRYKPEDAKALIKAARPVAIIHEDWWQE